LVAPNKSLGQHWLHDKDILSFIADEANLTSEDTVLEIGPGLGTLTAILLKRADKVVAVEFDHELARKLPKQFPGKNLEVKNADILTYDLTILPKAYKVVANVPYYITSKIVRLLMTSSNKPSIAILLVQKEVAQRLAAGPGDMSLMSIAAQLFAKVSLGVEVSAEYFTPPPKVDSQVVILHTRTKPLFEDFNEKEFFTVVRAGFSARRKKLRSSLGGGLQLDKALVDTWLERAAISPDMRAQELSLEQWQTLTQLLPTIKKV
jgi:16S rRNA (adenine1518-N6/adenine1519-N6)-dimethyltransferase